MRCSKLTYIILCLTHLVFAVGVTCAQTDTANSSKDKSIICTVRTFEQIVRFNVIDKKGQEVLGLTAKDFVLYESAQWQDIAGFTISDDRLKMKTGFRYMIAYPPDLPDGKYRGIRVLLKTKIKGRPKIQQSLKGYLGTKEHFAD